MAQVLEPLERTGELAGAAAHHRLGARRRGLPAPAAVCSGHGQWVGKAKGSASVGPLVQHHADDLRDHVAGALQDHGVADPDVLAGDLVGVVQGGVAHHHAADGHRLQPRHRGHRAGAADLDVDGLQDGARLLGRELAGDGPARRAGDEAQPLLPVQPVDLVDHAVDVDSRASAAVGLHAARRRPSRPCGVLDPLRSAALVWKPQAFSVCQRLPLGLGERRAEHAPGVGEEAQRPLGGDLRVDLAQRAGGGVARVGVGASGPPPRRRR